MQAWRQEYIYYIWSQIYNVIWLLGDRALSSSMLLIIWYLFFVIILIALYIYVQKTDKHITQLLAKSIDTIIYKQNLVIYANRQNIYNIHESLPILYNYMQTMMADETQRDYKTNYPLLKKDIEYLEQFFTITLPIEWKVSDNIYSLAFSIKDRSEKIKKSLIYMTLGIAKFFL